MHARACVCICTCERDVRVCVRVYPCVFQRERTKTPSGPSYWMCQCETLLFLNLLFEAAWRWRGAGRRAASSPFEVPSGSPQPKPFSPLRLSCSTLTRGGPRVSCGVWWFSSTAVRGRVITCETKRAKTRADFGEKQRASSREQLGGAKAKVAWWEDIWRSWLRLGLADTPRPLISCSADHAYSGYFWNSTKVITTNIYICFQTIYFPSPEAVTNASYRTS